MQKSGPDQARFSAQWSVNVGIEPGSVPDLPVQYSRTGKAFRPTFASFTFYAEAKAEDLAKLKMEAGSGYMVTARNLAEFARGTITGPSVLASGEMGRAQHKLVIWRRDKMPEWYEKLAAKYLADLGR